jgi:hypothetical protein
MNAGKRRLFAMMGLGAIHYDLCWQTTITNITAGTIDMALPRTENTIFVDFF